MFQKVVKEDFLEGGVFENILLPTCLPIPNEILVYMYGDICQMELKHQLDQLSQINLLKNLWELKGVEMFKCQCQSQDHLLTKEIFEEHSKFGVLTREQFKVGGMFENIELSSKLPLHPLLVNYIGENISHFKDIPEGQCFKSDKYLLNILQKCFNWKHHSPTFVCQCQKHLNFFL